LQPGLRFDFRRFDPKRPPAFVLGGLDLLPPLGFADIPAIIATADPREPARASRYCTGRCRLPDLANRAAAADKLLATGEELLSAIGCRVPLLYGNDDALRLIHEHRNALSRYFLLLLNEPGLTRSLLEHYRFGALARARGLPVPRMLSWAAAGASALVRAEGPVIVKARDSLTPEEWPVFLRLLDGPGKARVFENGRQVMAHPLARQLKDRLAFQEYVCGTYSDLWSFHGFADQRGRLLAWFTGRKLRTWPARAGMSSFLELARHDELPAIGRDVAARLGLKGIFKINFKQGARDGRFRVLGIDARYNLWHHVAAKNGVNLPRVAYDYLVHGERPARAEFRTSCRWVHFRLDYRAFRELEACKELTPARWAWSLLASRKVYHLLSWTDPMPFLVRLFDRLKSWARRGARHVAPRLGRGRSTASLSKS
jgi:predicted ATP-grasp superfamily ATP-dependent carboligase